MAKKEVSTDDIKLVEPAIHLDKGADAIQPVEGASANDIAQLAAAEAFMQEPLQVYLAEPANETETPLCEVTVNGRYHCYRRGDTHLIPRAAVEVIARSKIIRMATEKRIARDQTEEMVPVARTSPVYPFSVMNDPSGAKGAAWLKSVLSQPA